MLFLTVRDIMSDTLSDYKIGNVGLLTLLNLLWHSDSIRSYLYLMLQITAKATIRNLSIVKCHNERRKALS